jgi:hypothetical protein
MDETCLGGISVKWQKDADRLIDIPTYRQMKKGRGNQRSTGPVDLWA